MRLFSIGPNYFGINKFLLYGLIMGPVFYFTIIQASYRAIYFEKTRGQIVFYTSAEYQGKRGTRTAYFPVAEYKVSNDYYRCIGSDNDDELLVNDSVDVIYNPGNHAEGYLYTGLSYWGRYLTFFIPAFLTLTLVVFLDSIPTMLTIRIKDRYPKIKDRSGKIQPSES